MADYKKSNKSIKKYLTKYYHYSIFTIIVVDYIILRENEMAEQKKLTPAEWEIMESIWKLGGSPSIRDVVDHAYPTGKKAYTTVQTMMNTLVRKGILRRKKTGLVHFYRPLYTRKQMISREMSNLLARGFHNSVPALANFLLDTERISLEDIEYMKRLLKTKENELLRRS